MNARDEIAAHFTSATVANELYEAVRAEVLREAKREVVAWLAKKAGEYGTSNRENRAKAEAVYRMADKVDRGAIRLFLAAEVKASAPAPTATPQPDAMSFADGLTTLAGARSIDITPTSFGLHLDLVATRAEWDVWADELDVDHERTTNRGGSVTSHATWRGVPLAIHCIYSGGAR